MINMVPFYTMEMMKYAAELEQAGKKILHLEVGQSVFPTPQIVLTAAKNSLENNPLSYCSALGLMELRQAIATHYKFLYDFSIVADRIVIVPGTSFGLYLSLLMSFKKRSKIAIASPSYPCYRNIIESLDHILVEIKTTQENNYLLTPQLLSEHALDINGILIASPNNPTGSMYSIYELQCLAAYCENHNIRIISDELYHGITYEKPAQTILKFNQNAIVINGFSKYFAMTGWRVGWLVLPETEIPQYESLLQNIILCSSPLNQVAATAAFSSYRELDSYVTKYKINRDILFDSLTNVSMIPLFKPMGAFYIYFELGKTKLSSMDICKKLLYEENIAIAPGIDFCGDEKSCSIRLSFCQNQKTIEQAAEKLKKFLKRIDR